MRNEKGSEILKDLLIAHQIAKASKNNDLQFVIYRELGDYYLRHYDYSSSLRYFNLAKEIYTGKTTEEAFLDIVLKIAKINGEGDNTKFALDELNKVLNTLNHNPKDIPRMRAQVYQGLGAMNLREKKIELSKEYYQKAYDIFASLKDTIGMSRSVLGFGIIQGVLGSIEQRNGNNKNARTHFKASLDQYKTAEKIVSPLITGNDLRWGIMLYICDAHISLNNLKQATILAERVYNESAEAKKMRITMDACLFLTEIFNAERNFEKALKYNSRYVILRDSILSVDRSHDLLIQTISFEFNQKAKADSLKFISEKQRLEHALQLKEVNQRIIYIIFAGLVVIVGLIIAFYLYAVRQKKQEQKIEFERKLSEAKITTLLAQINPHFVFNSLNSILSFIQNSNKEEAIKYLSKFSKIIRHVLEGSDKQTVSVHDEITILKLYIELEQLRYNHLFDFDIRVNPSIDKFNTEIPVMMLQPFIENALIHGIQNKIRISREYKVSYKGELIVNYTQLSNKIVCTVTDNGIGRKKSYQLKNENFFGHRSLGIKFTEKRLELLSRNECRIIYNDLHDTKTNEPTGTEVIVELPILN
ncbi:MAG: hypothetical protein K0S32_205 [Bacteroidetes bacterium]|nr:hypothetical protein [Bacteroidota bacterium]